MLHNLPDEIYKQIYQYLFVPSHEIKRWDNKRDRWTNLIINKCHICKRKSMDTALAHLCDICNGYNKSTCHNQLICFDCAH